MDVNRARYFSALCMTGHMRRAAEMVHISPAALSKAVKTLEAELGVQLVTPLGRGIQITDKGRQLALRMKSVLEQIDRIDHEIRTAAIVEPLRIGSFDVFTTHFLSALIKNALPGQEIILHELTAGKLEQALLRRDVDIGVTYLPIPAKGLDYLKITTIEMGIFARTGCFKGVPFDRIPFVAPVDPLEGSPNRVQGRDGWPDIRVQRNIRYRVTLLESALELCRQGLAAVYMPRFVARMHNEKISPPFQLTQLSRPAKIGKGSSPVYLMKRKSDAHTPILKKMENDIRNACRPL